LREHLGLLYGAGLVDRIGQLSLDENDLRLSGMLIQLAVDESVSMLSGIDFLRLWYIDLLELIGHTTCSCADLISRFVGELDIDQDLCLTSIEIIYGENASGAFQRLSAMLMKGGRSFPDAVKEILDGLHGSYCQWGEAFLRLDAEYTAQLKVSFGT
jgi:hypothetical protein